MADLLSLVVSPIVDNIIEAAGSLIQEEFLLIHGVNKEVEKLSSTLSAIRAVLEDAEERQLEEAPLRDWLAKLKSAAYDAEDILDSFATEAALWKRKQQVRKVRPPFSITRAYYQSDAAHKIKDISAKIYAFAEERRNLHLNIRNDGGRSRNQPHPGSFVDTTDVFGRDADKERILELLLSNEYDTEGDISVIPIIGMGGLGKTTLAQLIFAEERVKNHFESRMWVCVTVEFDFRRIIKEMIQFHSKMKYADDLSSSMLESRLLEFLRRKRYLLVLDDVWAEDYTIWEPLQKLLKQGNKGSRVLVTSRTTKVANIMGTQPPYHLEYLPEDQCWSLFKKIAFKDNNLLGEVKGRLEDIGRQIVAKCKGLPLAVKAMGGVLRGNTNVNKWLNILSHEIWELEGSSIDRPNALPVLKLSYNYLPSYLKQCFAYCSIFPKAYSFVKEDLVKLWIAEVFINSKRQERAEEIGIEYFDELLARSFFQPSNLDNKERYRMHDLIHDLAQSVSNPYCYQVKDNNSCNCSEKLRHVSLLCQDVERPLQKIVEDSKKLRTLLLPIESLKNFGLGLEGLFHKLKYIHVLDMSSSTLLELPNSIGELKLLRYLDLSRTEIKMLPNSICNLYNLETLKLLGCLWLYGLPKKLSKLVNLRHLELDDMFWFKCAILPPEMGKLTCLHNLHAFRVGCKSGYGIGELKDMVNLTGALRISDLENATNAAEAKLNEKESLEKLTLEWSNGGVDPQDEVAEERVLQDLQPHSNLKELQIRRYKGARFPTWMQEGLLQNLVSLSLNDCTKCKTLSLSQLYRLGKLCIKSMQELEEWQEGQFPSLRELRISNCPKLRLLPNILPSLIVLRIKKSNSLKGLPVTPSVMFAILNSNLILEDWNDQLVALMRRNEQGQLLTKLQPSFVNLLELKVIGCPKLHTLPRIFFPQKLEISGCELLNTLPTQEQSLRLQHLALKSCQDGALVSAIPPTTSLTSLVISNIPNLASLSNWALPGLKALHISDCRELQSLFTEEASSSQSFSSLKTLSIRSCSKLATLPSEGLPVTLECLSIGSCPGLQSLGTQDTLKNLTSLKDLYIENCPQLPSFPEGGLPTSLQHLQIQGCPLLTQHCWKDGAQGPEWSKIMHVPDLEIDYAEVSTVQSLTTRKAPWFHSFVCDGGF